MLSDDGSDSHFSPYRVAESESKDGFVDEDVTQGDYDDAYEEDEEEGSDDVTVISKPDNSVEVLSGRLERENMQLKEANTELKHEFLRIRAEMENLRKRTGRDIEKAHKYALERFVKELLPVIDSMELGLSVAEQADSADDLKEGMQLTLQMFVSVFEKMGVTALDPHDEKFDPQRHEAVSEESDQDVESGMIAKVVQKGYLLNDRVIRPALVVVAK